MKRIRKITQKSKNDYKTIVITFVGQEEIRIYPRGNTLINEDGNEFSDLSIGVISCKDGGYLEILINQEYYISAYNIVKIEVLEL